MNDVLNAFKKDVGFVRFQINSYNNFVDNRLQKIIDEIGEIKPEVPEIGELVIKFGKISVGRPCVKEAEGGVREIMPTEARLRDFSYTAPVYLEATPIVNKVEQEPVSVLLAEIPIMVKSKLCPLSRMSREELEEIGEDPDDTGGYFIINGTERVLVLIEEIAPNRMILEKQNVSNYTEMIRINSERNGFIQRHTLDRKNDGSIYISFANIRRLPIVVLLKLLGLEKDKDIIEGLEDEKIINEFYVNLYETDVQTKADAMEYVGKHLKIVQKEYRKQRVEQIISKYLLPHLGQDPKNKIDKANYILKAIRKIIDFSLGNIPEDDLDHYGNKRIKLSGDLLELLFRSILVGRWGLIARIKYNYQKMAKRGKLPPVQTIVEANVVTNQLSSAMATGAWIGGRTGVSQRLERKNFIDTLSHLRLVLSPLTSTQEHFEARELHPTHWQRFCPAETPEGPTIGLRKHLALFAEVTKGLTDAESKKLESVIKLEKSGIDVYLDGVPIGYTSSPEGLIEDLRDKRRKGKISGEVNFAYYKSLVEVRINTDSGRLRRPLIILENSRSKLTPEIMEQLKKSEIKWKDLTKLGCIEYLDAEEEDSALVALKEKDITTEHTHLEMSTISIFGLTASLITFPEHNRGDRVCYGAKMINQSIGFYQSNFLLRSDTKSNILVYPQVPLVETDTVESVGLDKHPAGQNVVVAVACHKGYNMFDSAVFNKSSIERGMFRSMFYRVYPAEEKRYWGGQEDEIRVPDKDVRGYLSEDEYSRLAEDGILPPETQVKSDDVLIGRVSPLRFLSANELMSGIANTRESSITLRHGEKGVVDRVLLSETTNGNRYIKISTRDLRVPELGDKFASRHGQKSVMGLIQTHENMPFTSTGVVPDVILNPHSIPSRQTIGQLLEIIAGKKAAMSGKKANSSAFESESEESIRRKLGELGLRSDGKEVLYNGITGEKFEVEIFTGVLYYQKLDHMVANKLQARSRGPVTLLTRQPTEGKAKEGGLRLGEMEKDCLVAHGAVLTLKERFDSDKVVIPFCKKCGLVALWNKALEKNTCPACKGDDVSEVEMSYAFKLLLDELKSMLIYPKIGIKGSMIDSVGFNLMSPQMVKKMAVTEITKPELYDNDGFPLEGGVMDPRLGVIDPGLRCRTCGKGMGSDLGHFGYIELTKPVINVLYSKLIYKVLKVLCRSCGRVTSTSKTSTPKKCPHCGEELEPIKFQKPYTFLEGERMMTSLEVRERLEKITPEDMELLGIKGGRPEWLVITILPVSPVTMRPSITLETGERSEDDLTHKLVDVIRINQRLKENIEIGAPDFIIGDLWELLQYHVATFLDNSLSGIPAARHRSGRPLKTLSNRLKSKEGRFRQNLTGKRVNFSARTVISPDPCISINEVGVPKVIAKELTVPVTVTEGNIKDVKELIERSPIWPSANYVTRPDGKKKKITEDTKADVLEELAPGYIIERHLKNGDIVLFNRQPSLHRMSIMAHKVKVTPWRTFTLNLCTCPPYNADFDGDEMNLHVPQTEEAQTEAKLLMSVQKHIRSPRFGGPIIGCKEDHISGCYMLTHKDTVLSRERAFKLLSDIGVFADLPKKKTFTGKEIFSYLLPSDLYVEFKSKACGCDKCVKGTCPNDGYVVIKGGKLIRGLIDSRAISSEHGKLTDVIEKEFGCDVAHEFIDRVSSIGIKYLDMSGFTIGLDDVDLRSDVVQKIEKIVEKAKDGANELIEKFNKGEIEILPGSDAKDSLEAHILGALAKSTESAEKIIKDSIQDNCAIVMAKSGARASITHMIQLSAFTGQARILGERIHRGFRDRTLPHFKVGDLSPRAHGFSSNSFKSGLNPFEFFFDVVSGRESLMDKSLRTRHSGYLERRLMNALQDLTVDYNYMVKDNRDIIIQFTAGEDKIDPAKSDWGTLDLKSIIQSVIR
ncbi:MAG: DNA-directed RNA polymerase subunit A' [Candidatus Aenigmarchaeota archaeon]|nr:DNA-directed RNA polymerase subunit A' [Candidatus Aenigmarchaeota archaeon]